MGIYINILAICVIIQLAYYVYLLKNWNKKTTVKPPAEPPPVSIVICARNEAINLQKNLPFILRQNYPTYEVVVVDDGSDDDTAKTLEQLINQYSQLKTLRISPAEKQGSGKKYALQKGVENASHEIILVTDADCSPSTPGWVKTMVNALGGKDILLGISPYSWSGTFINGLVQYETCLTALQYIGYANAGMPYMAVGRNLCFRKKIFLGKEWKEREMQFPSGDDDLFIQAMADQTNTTTCTNPSSFTFSSAPSTFHEWYRQKKRHLATGFRYSARDQMLLGTFLTSKFFLYCAFFLALLAGSKIYIAWGLMFAYLYIATWAAFHLQELHSLNKRWYLSPVFDPVYVFSIIFTGIAARMAPQLSWK